MAASILTILGLIGGLLAPIYAVLVGLGKAPKPASAGWVLLTATALFFGLPLLMMGTPTTQSDLAAQIAITLSSHTGTAMGLGGAFMAVAVVASLTPLLSPGPEPEFRGSTVGGAIGGMVAGGMVSLLVLGILGQSYVAESGPVFFLAPALAAGSTLGLFLACLRDASNDVDRARLAGWRALFGLSCFMAILMVGEMFVSMGMNLAFQAVASASPDQKQAMLTNGIEVASRARVLALFAGLPLLTAGLGAGISARGCLTRDNAVGVVVASSQAALILFGLFLGATPLLGFLNP